MNPQGLDILYVGTRFRGEVADVETRGASIEDAASVFEAIARLKRSSYGAAVVEFGALGEKPREAIEALREAAGERPVLVSMSSDEWETVRGQGLFEQDEVLLRPYYPDELWRRVMRAALPPPARAVRNFRTDADRLAALINDGQRLNRFTADLPAFADHLVAIVKARLGAGRLSLFLRGENEGELIVAHSSGLSQTLGDDLTLRLGEGIAGELAQQKRVVLVREVGTDGPSSGRDDYRGSSYIIAPLMHEQQVLGVLCITERFGDGTFDDDDVAYLEAFSEMVGQIAHNALQFRAADELATIDEGTRLFNKRHFNRVLPQEVVRAKRYKHDLTLALLDIDHFKSYNDSNGHQAGDRALAIVAQILKESFREADIVVRYGGEEFVVIMPETSRKEGNGVGFVDRARRRVEEAGLTFEDAQGNERVLTLSGGVATLPLQADTWEELFDKADQALYKAKARGRNIIVGS